MHSVIVFAVVVSICNVTTNVALFTSFCMVLSLVQILLTKLVCNSFAFKFQQTLFYC